MITCRGGVSRLAWSIAGVAGLALPALAQNALDKNLQVGSGGVNPSRPDFGQEVRFRNAIVTGNVPGGLSFRGDVGYRAPGEFDANLGSNDLFQFRRDSYYSGLGGMGIRGTDALQYQFAATTGNAPPAGIGMYPTLRRTQTGTTAGMIGDPDVLRGSASASLPAQIHAGNRSGQFDDPGQISTLATIRSPAAFMATRDLTPTYIGSFTDAAGREQNVTVSSLRGIALDEIARKSEIPDMATRDSALTGVPREILKPEVAGQGPRSAKLPGETRPTPDSLLSPGALETPAVDTMLDTRVNSEQKTRSDYDELLDKIRQSGQKEVDKEAAARGVTAPTGTTGPTGDTGAAWQGKLSDVRAVLREQRPGARATDRLGNPAGAAPPSNPNDEPKPGESLPGDLLRPGMRSPGVPDQSTTPAPGATGATGSTANRAAPATRPGVSPDALQMLRAGRIEIRSLAPAGFDPYAQAMKAAQDHLAGGRYFDAEERFTSALAARNGDPMAAAGRVNAEVGAGMFLSAAINLRSLLVEHPEMTGAKYVRDLMPNPERLPNIKARLQELISETGSHSRDAGLLLAYVGYQSGDQDAIRRGLGAMVQGMPAGGTPDQLARLSEVLRGVWLEAAPGAAAPVAPTPAPPAPAPK